MRLSLAKTVLNKIQESNDVLDILMEYITVWVSSQSLKTCTTYKKKVYGDYVRERAMKIQDIISTAFLIVTFPLSLDK